MYTQYQAPQYHECLVCMTPLLQMPSFTHILHSLPLCLKCLNQFEVIDQVICFHHYPLRILYYYNAFFQSLLYQYKGLYDIALKDAFLCLYQKELRQRYKDYIVVVAPSAREDNERRGFAPIETLAYTFSKNVFSDLYKKEKYKQSDLSFEERKQVYQKIGICHGEILKGKKILILDDVITSGSTLLTCISLVSQYNPQCVELLVLSTKKNLSELIG